MATVVVVTTFVVVGVVVVVALVVVVVVVFVVVVDLFFVLLLNFLSLALGLLCKSLRVHMVCCIRRQRGTRFSLVVQLVQLRVWGTCDHSITFR